MSGGFFDSVAQFYNTAKQKIMGDTAFSNTVDAVEIPESQLRNQSLYVPFVPADEINLPDRLFVLHHSKSGLFHLAIRFHLPSGDKTFSVFRDIDSLRIVEVASLFSQHENLISHIGSHPEAEKKFKTFVDLLHKCPTWESLHFACAIGVKSFIDAHKAELLTKIHDSCKPANRVPLHLAIRNEHADVVMALMQLGSNVAITDSDGFNAFHYGSLATGEILSILSRHPNSRQAVNAENNSGETPLYLAAVEGKPDCLQSLIDAGASGENVRYENRTLLEAAMQSRGVRKRECVRIIARAFPKLVIVKNQDGDTPLHYCQNNELVHAMIRGASCQVSFDVRNARGDTPLHVAVRRSDLPTLVKLLAYECDIDAKNNDGLTPIHLSLSLLHDAGQLMIIKALLVFEADCSIPNAAGFLPRHVATTLSHAQRDTIAIMFQVAAAPRCSSETKGCREMCRYTRDDTEHSKSCIEASSSHDTRQAQFVRKTLSMKEKKEEFHCLLSLDGGGIKGIVLVQMLMELEKFVGVGTLMEKFHWVAGTSTGAIIAGGYCHEGHDRSLRDIQRTYFRFKDCVFNGIRPYDTSTLENFLKQELGGKATMADITGPKLILTTVEMDMVPMKLSLIRNYTLPVSPKENKRLGYDDPKTWPLWKAVRCSTAAPTYFDMVDHKYVDGGLIANNPTLDLLTEVQEYYDHILLHQTSDKKAKAPPKIGCVVSLGCGDKPTIPLAAYSSLAKPTNAAGAAMAVMSIATITELMINQTTAAGGRIVERCRAWCHSLGIPYFRLSPPLSKDVPLDTVDDATLVQILWDTEEYLHANQAHLETLAEILS